MQSIAKQLFYCQFVLQIFQDARNTVGNIPLSWYDDYPHIGYDLDGTKIMKPAKGDEVCYKQRVRSRGWGYEQGEGREINSNAH